MQIKNLIVSHNHLRCEGNYVAEMSQVVDNGGVFDQKTISEWSERNNQGRNVGLISINVFEDGKKMIHNGHHRVVAILAAGRNWLREDEYLTRDLTYEQYRTFAPENGWYTPFDPITEVRLCEFSETIRVLKMIKDKFWEYNPDAVREIVQNFGKFYKTQRKVWTIEEMRDDYIYSELSGALG